jgi:hypothetical protein
MSKKSIIIDNISIHLPNGWQGDPQILARQVSAQIQSQANNLSSAKQISLRLKGHYAGNPQLLNSQLGEKLANHNKNQAKRGAQ